MINKMIMQKWATISFQTLTYIGPAKVAMTDI